jgi:hypothetical protein
MSAADPLKTTAARRGQFRAVDPLADESGAARPRRRGQGEKSTWRPPDANFFCWKYGVWYNLMDCCYRHDHRTYEGCGPCGQGAGNLKANRERYLSVRHLGDRPRCGR